MKSASSQSGEAGVTRGRFGERVLDSEHRSAGTLCFLASLLDHRSRVQQKVQSSLCFFMFSSGGSRRSSKGPFASNTGSAAIFGWIGWSGLRDSGGVDAAKKRAADAAAWRRHGRLEAARLLCEMRLCRAPATQQRAVEGALLQDEQHPYRKPDRRWSDHARRFGTEGAAGA